jgi:hypothetical protein
MNRLELFLKDLSELTKKYGLVIRGCGCCGSPWIENLQEDVIEQKILVGDVLVENLYYNIEKQEYEQRS